MTRSTVILLSTLSAFAAVVLMLLGGFIGANNTAVRREAAIIAAHTDSQNVLGQYAPKLREALGVTKLQATAVADVITKANESRYGSDGSQATIQWITEQNPSLDQSGYRRVIDLIEAGRNDFQVAQTRKIDMVRSYKTEIGTFPGVMFYSLLGKPTPGFFEKYEAIVVSGHADEAFRTHRDDGVKID
ncbi:hypothetical protein [Novosphingobium resinovorum]|uniref:LemA family protein n=1 Tax=Novosphingobium resinovorum TaxID=158500 RepID=A0A1D8A362_9SPHN|nr:hypothetical protein [Novosphingobium resinovorum]AOR76557.1 hypothetical protein BES08_07205 [Novosphingobium resinovorum]